MRKIIGRRTYKADLETRERVNLTLDAEMMRCLRKLSASNDIPMCRMVDRAISKTYGSDLRKYGWNPVEK